MEGVPLFPPLLYLSLSQESAKCRDTLQLASQSRIHPHKPPALEYPTDQRCCGADDEELEAVPLCREGREGERER